MRREWSSEELIDCWTLIDDDWRLVGNKYGFTRLGFAVLLKFFELEARFPRHAGEVPQVAVDFVAEQVGVDPATFGDYAWSGRTIEYHRAQIREAHGFRECTAGDEDKLASWLAEEVCPVELRNERVREELSTRCRQERIEPPGRSRIDRIVGLAQAAFERGFTTRTLERLSGEVLERLEALLVDEDAESSGGAGGGAAFLTELKADPGQLGLETLLEEVGKLERVRAIGLPGDLFADASDKLVAAWRA